jgi:hypothetical protein
MRSHWGKAVACKEDMLAGFPSDCWVVNGDASMVIVQGFKGCFVTHEARRILVEEFNV